MLQHLPAILRRQSFDLMQDFSDAHREKLNRLAAKNKQYGGNGGCMF
jgi:hypothetical protein